jgi:hypothetical protein
MFEALLPNFYPSLLSVEHYEESRSPTGAIIKGYVAVAGMTDLPCRIAPQSGTESRTAEQVLTQDVQVCVTPIRLEGISTADRVVVDGNFYDLISIDYDGQTERAGFPGAVPRSTRLTLEVVS